MKPEQRIDTLHAKMARLVEEFAEGSVNRAQFHSLYQRYHRKLLEALQEVNSHPDDDDDWLTRQGDNEDTESSTTLRNSLVAAVDGLAIYNNKDSRAIATMGDFAINPALLIPLLAGTQQPVTDTPLANVRSTFVHGAQWLGIVDGQYTTLFVLYSLEPSEQQLETIEYMHRDFEAANRIIFKAGLTAPDKLAYTYFSLLGE